MNRKNISICGMVLSLIYFIVVASLIITQNRAVLTGMEIVTIISGIYMVLLVLMLPCREKSVYRTLSIIFVSTCMALTSISHFGNLLVVDPLIKKGIHVPDYFQIGKIPSFEMAIDYLGWGLFLGTSFICACLDVKQKNMKYTLLICGLLCLIGFFGAIANEKLWYIAPMGYGVGAFVICFELLGFEGKCCDNNRYKK